MVSTCSLQQEGWGHWSLPAFPAVTAPFSSMAVMQAPWAMMTVSMVLGLLVTFVTTMAGSAPVVSKTTK
jgi:hypothetical protein